jgi:hypothetical protein
VAGVHLTRCSFSRACESETTAPAHYRFRVEEQQPRPALLLVVHSGRLTLDLRGARNRARKQKPTVSTRGRHDVAVVRDLVPEGPRAPGLKSPPLTDAIFGLAAAALPAGASADPGTHSKLTAIAGQGAGLVEVAPTAHDVVGPDTFDVPGTVNVHHAAPNTTFTVLRRVDLNQDGVCTGLDPAAAVP